MAVISSAVAAIGIGVGAAGLGASLFGSSEAADVNQQILAQQRLAEEQRRKAMELDARRKTMEALRNQQRARSLALTNATSQGAGQGSGLQGGYGQISGATNWNTSGISQNLGIGRNMFDINQTISGLQSQLVDAQQWSSLGSGLMSFGSSLFNASGTLGNMFGGGASAGPQMMPSPNGPNTFSPMYM